MLKIQINECFKMNIENIGNIWNNGIKKCLQYRMNLRLFCRKILNGNNILLSLKNSYYLLEFETILVFEMFTKTFLTIISACIDSICSICWRSCGYLYLIAHLFAANNLQNLSGANKQNKHTRLGLAQTFCTRREI